MTTSIAVLSGFGPRFADKLRIQLKAAQIRSVFVGRGSSGDEAYLDRLVDRTCAVLADLSENEASSLHLMLVSCFDTKRLVDAEWNRFFPAVRRFAIDPGVQAQSRGELIVRDAIKEQFLTWQDAGIRQLSRPRTNAEILLPLRNAGSKNLVRSIEQIARFEASSLARNVMKQISRVKGGAGLQIGNLIFRGMTNPVGHPVRRISNNSGCDLKAMVRLGHAVPAQFEFDVSPVGGWNSRKFWHCDGNSASVPNSATHVNMRINGDHS